MLVKEVLRFKYTVHSNSIKLLAHSVTHSEYLTKVPKVLIKGNLLKPRNRVFQSVKIHN